MLHRAMRPFVCFAVALFASTFNASPGWMPTDPGPARGHVTPQSITIENNAIRLYWCVAQANGDGGLSVRNLWDGQSIDAGYGYNHSKPVELIYPQPDGKPFAGSRYLYGSSPRLVKVRGGYAIEGAWGGAPHVSIHWRLTLMDGANYARSETTLTAGGTDENISEVVLSETDSKYARVEGTVAGSPIVANDIFLGVEHPMAVCEVADGRAVSFISRKLPLKAGQSVTYSAVIGVAPPGQLRRAFLNYLEHERPRPYKPFLHYNSWYDLGYFNRYTADECVERIHTFGEELAVKRGVKLSSFLFDDGWDDPNTVWNFTEDFPSGFLPLKAEAAKYHAEPGAWLSPWGGYGTPRKERLAAGAKSGMEIDGEGYALSGPRYYRRFRDVCLDLVTNQGINQFKFDGTGSPDKQYPGSAFGSDFEAAIQLIKDLRVAKPGLFINLTTGTWPSPFWTRYADSIWRGGEDHSFAGVGPDRERWITYRDGDTFHGIVQKGPLYPLNSLMLHGIIYAQHAHNLSTDPSGAFRHEVRSYFGTGTQLQEMYITPSLLSKQNWDDLAEAAKWSQANADVLVDTHWVGGDPLKLEVYGWAAWSPRKAILTLRNPSDKPQAFLLNPSKVFEIPANFLIRGWDLTATFTGDSLHLRIPGFSQKTILLKPFEVVTLEGRMAASPVDTVGIAIATHTYITYTHIRALAAPFRIASVVSGSGAATVNAASVGNSTVKVFDISRAGSIRAWNPNVVVLSFGDVHAKNLDDLASQYQTSMGKLFADRGQATVFVAVPNGDEKGNSTSLLRQVVRERFLSILKVEDGSSKALAEALSDRLVDRRADKKGWRLMSTDSEQPGEGPAKAAIDGDPNTYWHTRYDPKLDKLPHEIVVDMGKEESIAGFRYLPRQDGGVNGRVKNYQFFVSLDGKTWSGPVAEGAFPNTLEASRVKLKAPVTGRYFRFVELSEMNGQEYGSAAEIDVIRAK